MSLTLICHSGPRKAFAGTKHFWGKEIEKELDRGGKHKRKVLERIRKILLNVNPYEIGVVGMVILWTVNEKKGIEEKQELVV